jgi:hypothetical protein
MILIDIEIRAAVIDYHQPSSLVPDLPLLTYHDKAVYRFLDRSGISPVEQISQSDVKMISK